AEYLGDEMAEKVNAERLARGERLVETKAKTGKSETNGKNGNGNGHGAAASAISTAAAPKIEIDDSKLTDRYGILVFSHLRWGFVWQRPQQFLSRFARKHPILFVEEPFFDLREGAEPRVDYHRVMPNVTVVTPHVAPSLARSPNLPTLLRESTRQGIDNLNEEGAFER